MIRLRQEEKQRTRTLIARLRRAYPDAQCSLHHTNPLELLVATILSAQCTDERVNIVTETLFRKYRSPQDYLDAPEEELAEDIRPTGFFNQKTRSIRGACRLIVAAIWICLRASTGLFLIR